MSLPLLKPIIKNNYADSDVTLPPSCNDFLAAFNPACLTKYCAVQTVAQTLGAPKAVGSNQNSLVCNPPPSLFHSVWHTWQKDLLQQSQQLDVNAATNSTDLKPKPQKKSLHIASIFFLLFFLAVSDLCVWPEESSAKRWLRFLRLQKYQHPRLQPGDSQDSVTEVALAKLLAPSDRPVCPPYLCHLTVGFVLF